MPSYTRPPGTEGSPWEDFREETGGNDSKEDFQIWLANQKIKGRYEDITDFGSEYYQQARGLFGKILPQEQDYLSGLQAGGGNFGASQVQAAASQRGLEKRRNDFLNTTVSQFALGSQSQAGGLLGLQSQNSQFLAQIAEQRRQFDESQTSVLEDIGGGLLNIGAGAAGFALGGPGGAAIGYGLASGAQGGTNRPSAPITPGGAQGAQSNTQGFNPNFGPQYGYQYGGRF